MRFYCGQRQGRDLNHSGFVPANDAALWWIFHYSALLAYESNPIQRFMLIVVLRSAPFFVLPRTLSANLTEQQISFSHATHTASLCD